MARRRRKQMLVRLTEEEFQFVEKETGKTALKKEAFARSRILGKPIPLKNHPDASLVIRELNAIGNNVNQIARQAHLGNPIPQRDFLLVRKAFEELRAQVMEVMGGGTDENMGS